MNAEFKIYKKYNNNILLGEEKNEIFSLAIHSES